MNLKELYKAYVEQAHENDIIPLTFDEWKATHTKPNVPNALKDYRKGIKEFMR